MRCSIPFLVSLGGLLAGSLPALAQYDPNVAHRHVRPLELWPELQGELALNNGDYLLLSLHGERVANRPDFGYYVNRPLGLDTRRLSLAYEHFLNANWSWGATARYEWDARYETNTAGDLLVPEVLLRHRSKIFGGLTFGQRLGVERQILVNRHYLGGPGPNGQFWTRLRVDVERLFPLSSTEQGLALRPRLSYAASTHLRFQKADTDAPERTIQFTSLRAEVGVRLSPAIDFTPWFAYQTQYRQDLVFTDITGKPVSGGKANNVYPTLGLDLRFTILNGSNNTERVQLPTQH